MKTGDVVPSSTRHEKDKTIRSFLVMLFREIDPVNLRIVDHWDADRRAIGIASTSDLRLLVYISTSGQAKGRYFVECETPSDLSEKSGDPSFRTTLTEENADFDSVVATIRRHLGIT